LFENGEYSKSRSLLEKYIDSDDINVSESLKEEALYLYIKWGFSFNVKTDCEKYAAYYPKSQKVGNILAFGNYAEKPLLNFNNDFSAENNEWMDGEFTVDKETFQRKKTIFSTERKLKDYHGRKFDIIVEYAVFQKDDLEEKNPAAYVLIISSKINSEQ